MNLTHTLTLALGLAAVAQAAEPSAPAGPLGPKESPVVRAARPAPPVPLTREEFDRVTREAKAAALHGTVPTTTTVPAALPALSKEERLADWHTLPALDAYRLYKDLGQQMPRELALQFNASLDVTPWNESLRQAGGSPGTALPVADTYPGATFQDSGNTSVLSNYLGSVSYTSGPCIQTSGFNGNDAWYAFTLDTPTRVVASTCNGVTGFDTILGVFNTLLEMEASDDDFCGNWPLHSTIDCCLDPGVYYLVVDGYGGGSGLYDLEVSFLECPSGPFPTRGGPDAFGYTWYHSSDPDGPDPDWQDISGFGTPVTLSDDSYSAAVPIGFPFPFYGTSYTDLVIGSNGLLGFGNEYMNSLSNTWLPDSYVPNNLIAGFWDDLNPGAGGSITYFSQPYVGRMIVQFTNVPAYGTGGIHTFQVILHQGGDIVIQHLDLQDDDLSQATVGIENGDGTIGLTANWNGSPVPLADNSSFRFCPPRETQGGPDAFGYTWASSQDANGPAGAFQDISWATNLGLTGDDQVTDLTLPFAFPFYGSSYMNLRVCSNGWAGFNQDLAWYVGEAIPSPNPPNNTLFVLQDDLYLPLGGAVYYLDESYNGRVTVSWQGIPHIYGSAVPLDFQVVLYTDGRIDYRYRNISDVYVGTATVGIDNADGTVGLQVAHDGAGSTLLDNLVVRITPPGPRPTRGGPDSGYTWANNLDPAGPEYLFTDISATGIDLGIAGDDAIGTVALPFEFPFFGQNCTAAVLCSNGWLSFAADVQPYYTNQPIPTPGYVDNAIFPFWDDLVLYGGVSTLYYLDQSAMGRVVFQWNQAAHYGTQDGPYTFQVMLYSNGEIYVSYGDMGGTDYYGVASATVGVEDAFGTGGLQVNFDNGGGLIANGVTVALMHNPPAPQPPARPMAITDLRIVADASPNPWPFLFHYEWSPVTQDEEGNPVTVEYYDFYYTFGLNPYPPFPSGWYYYTSFYGTNTGTLSHGMDDIAVRIVAVDTDGNVLSGDTTAGSSPVEAATLRSRARVGDGTVLWSVEETPVR
jgi:hypothetical protein